jgi:hypothetical protein
MDDRSITAPRWLVVRVCESSRHQRRLLAQVYQQVFPQIRQSLSGGNGAAILDGSRASHRAAARIAAGA